MSDKIKAHHLDRKALLYVRQSSAHQVMHNQESQKLQYAMRDRLRELGWREIEVIDDDLGRSAAGAVIRAGFERMVAEVDGHFETIKIRSEPKQKPPYRPLGEVIKAEQVVHALQGVQGTLIAFRFPAAASSVNVAGWHFHFLTSDKTRGGHVLDLTTGAGQASLEEIADLRISFPAQAPAASASAEAIRDVERPQ